MRVLSVSQNLRPLSRGVDMLKVINCWIFFIGKNYVMFKFLKKPQITCNSVQLSSSNIFPKKTFIHSN